MEIDLSAQVGLLFEDLDPGDWFITLKQWPAPRFEQSLAHLLNWEDFDTEKVWVKLDLRYPGVSHNAASIKTGEAMLFSPHMVRVFRVYPKTKLILRFDHT